MSKTPRTDKVKTTALTERNYDKIKCVPVELSYQLEAELADKEKQLAESRAEIEHKNRLIEQMRDALRQALPEARSTHAEQTILAALAAERGR